MPRRKSFSAFEVPAELAHTNISIQVARQLIFDREAAHDIDCEMVKHEYYAIFEAMAELTAMAAKRDALLKDEEDLLNRAEAER